MVSIRQCLLLSSSIALAQPLAAQFNPDSTVGRIALPGIDILVFTDSSFGVAIWVNLATTSDVWSLQDFDPDLVELWIPQARRIMEAEQELAQGDYVETTALPGSRSSLHFVRQRRDGLWNDSLLLVVTGDTTVPRGLPLPLHAAEALLEALAVVGPRARGRPETDVVQKTQPVLRRGDYPSYPHLLERLAVSGQVFVMYVVDSTGRVNRGDVHVIYSDNELFTNAVLEALSGWRFDPAERSGSPVAARVNQRFNFEMPPPDPDRR
jgi:TonB family protein